MHSISLALFLLLHSVAAYALSPGTFPSTFELKQQVHCEKKYCMVLTAQGKKLGFLQLSEEHKNLFYFFDENGTKQLSIKKTHTPRDHRVCGMNDCPVLHHFDIYEANNHLIAQLDLSYDVMQSSFDTFKLYTQDKKHLLLLGSHSTISGTQSNLYDGRDPQHKMALISKSLFTFSLDSTISVSDPARLWFTVDPNVFAATLALYCNTSLFHANFNPESENIISTKTLSELRQKLQDLAETEGFLEDMHAHISDRDIKRQGRNLSLRYQETYGDFWDSESLFNKENKLRQLFDLGIDLILSHSLTHEEEKALFQFLILQLYINQPD